MVRAATALGRLLRSLTPARWPLAVVVCACACMAQALTFSNRYRSPRNPERRIRPATRLVILHTTEAHARSSLNKLSERGEAHYCLTEDGTAYRIIDRDRVAFHAGRSMWNGREDCDEYAIGIEVVGFHDKPMPLRQLAALRDLIDTLKKLYGLSDVQVICHSHVAYGAPNRWQRKRHRGRKRCGMLFAMWSVRRKLGLTTRPACDPDVRAGRLVQADKFLQGVLYGPTDTMARHYAGGRDVRPATESTLLSGLGNLFGFGSRKADRPAKEERSVSPATPGKAGKGDSKRKSAETSKPADAVARVPKGPVKKPTSADVVAGSFRTSAHLVENISGNYYLLPDGRYFRDDVLPQSVTLPPNVRRLMGYKKVSMTAGTSAFGLVGKAWHAADTYYVKGDTVQTGDKVEARTLGPGTVIFYRP